jgi:hypothetical protein
MRLHLPFFILPMFHFFHLLSGAATRSRDFRELLSASVEDMLLNGTAQIEENALPFPQFALLQSVPRVQLKLITVLGNCGCVAVASFLGVPSPLHSMYQVLVSDIKGGT